MTIKRTRERANYADLRFLRNRTVFPNRNPVVLEEWMDWKVQTTYERIVSEPYPNRVGPKIREVDHLKIKLSGIHPIAGHDGPVNDFWWGPGYMRHFFNLNYAAEHNDFGSKIPWDSYVYSWIPDPDTLIDRRIDRVWRPPDLVQFLAESGDIPDMIFESWRRLQWVRMPAWLQWRSILNDARSLNAWRDCVANGVLSANLAVLPLASDIGGLWELCTTGASQWGDMISLLQEPQGFTFTDSVESGRESVWENGAMNYVLSGTHRRIAGGTCKANHRLSLYHENDIVADVNNVWVTLNAMGVSFDLATIWNLTPLSFVADYIYPVGQVLRSTRLYSNPVISDGWVSDVFDGQFSGHCYADSLGYSAVQSAGGHYGLIRHYKRYRHVWDRPDGIALEPRARNLFPEARESMNTLSLFLNTMTIGRRRRRGYRTIG